MLPLTDLAAIFVMVGEGGAWLLRVDRFAHSPAALKRDIDGIEKRLDAGNERYSTGMGKVNTKMDQIDNHLNAVDNRVTWLEGFHDAEHSTPRPRTR